MSGFGLRPASERRHTKILYGPSAVFTQCRMGRSRFCSAPLRKLLAPITTAAAGPSRASAAIRNLGLDMSVFVVGHPANCLRNHVCLAKHGIVRAGTGNDFKLAFDKTCPAEIMREIASLVQIRAAKQDDPSFVRLQFQAGLAWHKNGFREPATGIVHGIRCW